MGPGRVELPTSRLSGVRSNHLSYRPDGVPWEERFEAENVQKPDSNLGKSQRDSNLTLRKEVIQPQVLLRLPCYDFTPIMSYTLGGYLSCELAHRLLVQPTFVM